MNINDARKIVENPELTADNPLLRNKPFIAQGYIEAYEQFEPLAKALEDIEDMNPGDFDVTHAAWIAREALKTFREREK